MLISFDFIVLFESSQSHKGHLSAPKQGISHLKPVTFKRMALEMLLRLKMLSNFAVQKLRKIAQMLNFVEHIELKSS